MFLVLFIILFFVPNVKVKVSSAVVGAAFGTITMSLFYFIFTHLIIYSVKYSVIYGSLASILLVLLFLYSIWYILILMSEITFIYQFRPEKDETEGRILTPQKEIEESLRVLVEIVKSYEKGEGGISLRVLASRSRVVYFRVLLYVRTLENYSFIAELPSSRYVPSRPAEKMELSEVLDLLFACDSECEIKAVESFKKAGLESIKGKTLKDLI